jgi:hypothetical protein
LTIFGFGIFFRETREKQMRKIPVLILTILYAASLSYAQTDHSHDSEHVDDKSTEIQVDPASKARISIPEDMWDFGSIPLNSVVAHDFPIKNVGTDTLVITEVKPICGCTTAPLESDRIAPGEETNLHVQLNTKKLNGLVRKFINITCSDPVSPYLRVGLRAVINDPKQVIVVSPNMADFGNVLKGEKKSVALSLSNSGESDLSIDALAMPDENIIASKLGTNLLKAGETTELTFDLSDQIGVGPVVSSLTIESAGKPETRISIPITGTIVE